METVTSWESKSWTLDATGTLGSLLDDMSSNLESRGGNATEILRIISAAEEAIKNGREHGNKNDDTKVVEVVCKIQGNVCYVLVRDQGEGFVPEDLPDPTAPERLINPRGRGVRIYMQELLDQVNFPEEIEGQPIKRGSAVVLSHRIA